MRDKDERVTCPACWGDGVDCGLACVSCGHLMVEMTCRLCDGGGTITAEQADWRRRGEECRSSRLRRGLTLRAACNQFGMSATELIGMQYGLASPAPLERALGITGNDGEK